jgi:hypothetical protein
MTDAFVLPAGGRLLHIGPHKTGSTAIQDALHQSRDELAAQGVVYVSRNRHEATAARWVTGRLVEGHDARRAGRRWSSLTAALRAEGPERKVFSSEFLSDATQDQVERIVEDVGGEQTYVAVTLRPLASILPSQYQQYLQRGSTFGYHKWLDAMLNKPPYDRPTPSFWVRHRHDALVERWAKVVGGDRVIVLVVDSRDFTVAPRAFEQVLGLTDGTLADKQVTVNRSMTWAEAEVMRTFNRQFKRAGLPPHLHLTLMRTAGAHVKKRRPGTDEHRIATPEWAVRRANEIGAEMVRAIEETGAQIVGDLSLLSSAPVKGDGLAAPPKVIPVTIASHFAAGFAMAADETARQAAEDVRLARARARKATEAARAARAGRSRPEARTGAATFSLPRRAVGRARRALGRG